MMYEKLNRLSEAVELYEESLKIMRNVFGCEHPWMLDTRDSLARVYY